MHDACYVRGKKLLLASQIGLAPAPRACTCGKRSKHFIDDSHFFLAFLGQRYQRGKFWFSLAFLSTSSNGESFYFHWHFCPRLPTVKVLVILATVAFIDHFGYEYQR